LGLAALVSLRSALVERNRRL